jgi:hypothetical protein
LLYEWKTFLALFLFLLLSSLLVTVPVRSEVIHPYDWVKVGAYAKYVNLVWGMAVKFPNGTRLKFDHYTPSVLEWTIVEKQGDTARLNVTLFINGTATIYPPGVTTYEAEQVTYLKTLIFDVNVSTREASLDGQPVGKTFFWAEPYATAGEEFTVASPPSDLIVGNVTYVKAMNHPAVGKEITVYGVQALQRDPFATGSYVFSWYTGVAIDFTLLSPWTVPPDMVGPRFQYHFQNGTAFNITRYAGEPLGTNLGLDAGSGSLSVLFDLNETNIDLSAQTSPEPAATDSGIWRYLPYALVATFVGLAVAFIVVRRRKKRIRTASTASSSNFSSCLMFPRHTKAFSYCLFSK